MTGVEHELLSHTRVEVAITIRRAETGQARFALPADRSRAAHVNTVEIVPKLRVSK